MQQVYCVQVPNKMSILIQKFNLFCLICQGCDIVIALTHMRNPNDLRLMREVPEIDIVLGGHDHVYEIHEVHAH